MQQKNSDLNTNSVSKTKPNSGFTHHSTSKIQKLTLLAALYISQGLPYGFFTQALPVLLRKAELSLPAIGFANLLTLPWALKFLWAPAVDRYQFKNVGLRRSWLLPLQVLTIVVFSLLSLVTPNQDLTFVLWAFLITNLLAAAQDIATDGLAVDLLNEKDRGWANGIQVAGYRMGMVIGGGALLAIYNYLQWHGLMLAMAVVAFVCTIPVWLFREAQHAPIENSKIVVKEIFHFLSKPGAIGWAVILMTYKYGHASATGMLRPWLVDIGYSMIDIAWILGTAAFVLGLLGAMAGGALASKFPQRRSQLLIILGFVQCFAIFSYLWPLWTNHETYKVAISTALDHFSSGMATTVLFTLMMDACSSERAAADYTLQSCLVVVAQQIATSVSGLSAQFFGYSTHFLLSACVEICAVVITAILISRPKTRALLLPISSPTAAL